MTAAISADSLQYQIWYYCITSREKKKVKIYDADNVNYFLLKDEDAIKPIDEAVAENNTKSVNFKGKLAYKIVRADSVTDDIVLVPETHEGDGYNEQNVGSVILEESLTPR